MSELGILAAGARQLTARPIAADDTRYRIDETSTYGTLVVALLVATLLELAVVHFLVAAYVEQYQLLVHIGVVLVHAYGALWLLGDWRRMRETGHRVTSEAVIVQLGDRWQVDVPYANIADYAAGEVEELDALQGEKPPADTLRITPWDNPNFTIELTEPLKVRSYFGITKEARVLQLFVDRPRDLQAAIEAVEST